MPHVQKFWPTLLSNRDFTEITRWEPLSLNGKGLRAVSEQRTRNNRKSRSSVFLCFETKEKRLLRKLGAAERKRISQGRKLREMSTFELNNGSRLKSLSPV